MVHVEADADIFGGEAVDGILDLLGAASDAAAGEYFHVDAGVDPGEEGHDLVEGAPQRLDRRLAVEVGNGFAAAVQGVEFALAFARPFEPSQKFFGGGAADRFDGRGVSPVDERHEGDVDAGYFDQTFVA